jgi:hypothetical protein
MITTVARPLLLATSRPKRRAFVRDCRAPEAAQARVWADTWAEIGGAPFWRTRMGIGSATPELGHFPLSDYETYREPLDASFAGPTNQLALSEVRFWSESAGSTGPRKVFPITGPYRAQFQSTTPPFLNALVRRYPGMLRAPILYFAGSMPKERSPAGVDVGFISNYNYRNIPGFLRRLYAFPVEALRDTEAFFEWGPLYALATDLSAMIGITPAIIVRFAERLRERLDAYWPILEGRRDPPAPLPKVHVCAARLARLKKALGGDDYRFPEVWPGLSVLVCWKAATCGMQLPSLARYLDGRVPLVDATYSATEGWVNVPRVDGSVGGAVHPGAHVFEFLPIGADARADNLVPLWELEPGRDYEIVMTTAMGLVRYRLKDVVSVTGRFHRSPVLHFSHKSSNEISLGPACISEPELVQAVQEAGLDGIGSRVFAPGATGDRLELCAARDASEDQLARLEATLRRINPMYAKYAGDGILQPVALRRLPDAHRVFARDEHAQEKPRLLLFEPVED